MWDGLKEKLDELEVFYNQHKSHRPFIAYSFESEEDYLNALRGLHPEFDVIQDNGWRNYPQNYGQYRFVIVKHSRTNRHYALVGHSDGSSGVIETERDWSRVEEVRIQLKAQCFWATSHEMNSPPKYFDDRVAFE